MIAWGRLADVANGEVPPPVPPSVVRVIVAAALITVALCTLGCGANPLAPSGEAGQGVTMPDDLRPAYDLADRPAPRGTTIVWAELPGLSGRYVVADRRIEIGAHLRGQDARVVAGVVAHEIRHAEGARHDCADGVRDRTDGGAWGTHAEVLARLGVANDIRGTMFCGGVR